MFAEDPAAAGNRDELVEAVFRSLSRGRGYLSCSQMEPFARFSGFDGSKEDWRVEFDKLVCAFGAKSGQRVEDKLFQLGAFRAMVDEESQNGIFTTNWELAKFLESWSPTAVHCPAPVVASGAPSSSDGRGVFSSWSRDAHQLTRWRPCTPPPQTPTRCRPGSSGGV